MKIWQSKVAEIMDMMQEYGKQILQKVKKKDNTINWLELLP